MSLVYLVSTTLSSRWARFLSIIHAFKIVVDLYYYCNFL